jgi:hypothetical protein
MVTLMLPAAVYSEPYALHLDAWSMGKPYLHACTHVSLRAGHVQGVCVRAACGEALVSVDARSCAGNLR